MFEGTVAPWLERVLGQYVVDLPREQVSEELTLHSFPTLLNLSLLCPFPLN